MHTKQGPPKQTPRPPQAPAAGPTVANQIEVLFNRISGQVGVKFAQPCIDVLFTTQQAIDFAEQIVFKAMASMSKTEPDLEVFKKRWDDCIAGARRDLALEAARGGQSKTPV